MVAAVEKSGLPNLVWYNYRFLPAVTLAKNIVAAGDSRIGRSPPSYRRVAPASGASTPPPPVPA